MEIDDKAADRMARDVAKEARLREILHRSAWADCLRGGIPGVLAGLGLLAFLVWQMVKQGVPSWGFMAAGLAFLALMGSMRNADRLDALVELLELENRRRRDEAVPGPGHPGAPPRNP